MTRTKDAKDMVPNDLYSPSAILVEAVDGKFNFYLDNSPVNDRHTGALESVQNHADKLLDSAPGAVCWTTLNEASLDAKRSF